MTKDKVSPVKVKQNGGFVITVVICGARPLGAEVYCSAAIDITHLLTSCAAS